MSKKKRSDYQVGYKKPPRATQFKPGQSGNPNGRPRRKGINFAETFAKELRATITANEAGKPRRMSILQAIAKRQTIKAIGGDQRATELLIKTIEPRAIEQTDNLSPLLREMRAIHEMQSLADQIRDRVADPTDEADGAEK